MGPTWRNVGSSPRLFATWHTAGIAGNRCMALVVLAYLLSSKSGHGAEARCATQFGTQQKIAQRRLTPSTRPPPLALQRSTNNRYRVRLLTLQVRDLLQHPAEHNLLFAYGRLRSDVLVGNQACLGEMSWFLGHHPVLRSPPTAAFDKYV